MRFDEQRSSTTAHIKKMDRLRAGGGRLEELPQKGVELAKQIGGQEEAVVNVDEKVQHARHEVVDVTVCVVTSTEAKAGAAQGGWAGGGERACSPFRQPPCVSSQMHG